MKIVQVSCGLYSVICSKIYKSFINMLKKISFVTSLLPKKNVEDKFKNIKNNILHPHSSKLRIEYIHIIFK